MRPTGRRFSREWTCVAGYKTTREKRKDCKPPMSRPSPRAVKKAMLHAGDLQSESQHSVLRRRLMQHVQCGACPKPLQLSVAVRVLEPHGFTAAIRVVDAALDRFCQCKTVKPDQVEPVIGQNPV